MITNNIIMIDSIIYKKIYKQSSKYYVILGHWDSTVTNEKHLSKYLTQCGIQVNLVSFTLR